MHHIILHQSKNKRFKKDATHVFIPESRKLETFIKERGDTSENHATNGNQWDKDAIKADLFDSVLLRSTDSIDAVHFLCHGWKTGIQFGFKRRSGARILGGFIGSFRPKYVNLYACLTGKESDNFALWTYERLKECYGSSVFDDYPRLMCHTTRGHATGNPNVKTYFTDENGKTQSCMVYTRTHKLFWIWWYLLRTTDLCFEFPFITKEQISEIVTEASEQTGIWQKMRKLRKKLLGF